MSANDRAWPLRAVDTLVGALRIPAPDTQQDRAILHDQASFLYRLSVLFFTIGVTNIAGFLFVFSGLRHLAVVAAAALVIGGYVAILLAANHWRRTRDNVAFIRRSRLMFTVLGSAWGVLFVLLARVGVTGKGAVLLGIAIGLVSTPIIAVPASVAYAFYIPCTLLCAVGIIQFHDSADPVAGLAFVSFASYAAIGIMFTNRAFRGRAEARAALQREMDTVQVFLREYEEGTPDWLWETNARGRIVKANRNMATALGQSADTLHGQALWRCVAEHETETGRPRLARLLARRIAFRDLVVTVSGQQTERWLSLTGHPVYDERGKPAGFRGIGRDITAEHMARRDIAFLAEHDGLTGLLNRAAFLRHLHETTASGRPVALALIDIDDFKNVNDVYGHAVGDILLEQTARRMSADDPAIIAARFGGDEFAILLADTAPDRALATLTELHTTLSQSLNARDIVLEPSTSMGVGFAANGDDHDQLMLRADLALYSAKRDGKNRIAPFDDWMEQDYLRRMRCEAELREALAGGQIVVAYQTIVDVVTGLTVACEALARWQHPERGLLLPAAFIDVAERGELIDQIGERVLRLACHEAATWSEPIQVNVNLSPRQLRQGHFIRILTEALADSGLAPGRLGIEVTESTLLDDDDKTRCQLNEIRALGVKLILDDFGSDYSSLSYLQDIDVDGIKIDRSFTSKLDSNKVRAICRMVAHLAMELNVYVVAEGVESREQLEWLRLNGIAFGQGFLVGRPTLHRPARQSAYLAL